MCTELKNGLNESQIVRLNFELRISSRIHFDVYIVDSTAGVPDHASDQHIGTFNIDSNYGTIFHLENLKNIDVNEKCCIMFDDF